MSEASHTDTEEAEKYNIKNQRKVKSHEANVEEEKQFKVSSKN